MLHEFQLRRDKALQSVAYSSRPYYHGTSASDQIMFHPLITRRPPASFTKPILKAKERTLLRNQFPEKRPWASYGEDINHPTHAPFTYSSKSLKGRFNLMDSVTDFLIKNYFNAMLRNRDYDLVSAIATMVNTQIEDRNGKLLENEANMKARERLKSALKAFHQEVGSEHPELNDRFGEFVGQIERDLDEGKPIEERVRQRFAIILNNVLMVDGRSHMVDDNVRRFINENLRIGDINDGGSSASDEQFSRVRFDDIDQLLGRPSDSGGQPPEPDVIMPDPSPPDEDEEPQTSTPLSVSERTVPVGNYSFIVRVNLETDGAIDSFIFNSFTSGGRPTRKAYVRRKDIKPIIDMKIDVMTSAGLPVPEMALRAVTTIVVLSTNIPAEQKRVLSNINVYMTNLNVKTTRDLTTLTVTFFRLIESLRPTVNKTPSIADRNSSGQTMSRDVYGFLKRIQQTRQGYEDSPMDESSEVSRQGPARNVRFSEAPTV